MAHGITECVETRCYCLPGCDELMIRVGAFRQEPACWFAVAGGMVGENLWGGGGNQGLEL